MTRARDVASILTAASVLGTDVETATAISTHASAEDPHGDRAAATTAINLSKQETQALSLMLGGL